MSHPFSRRTGAPARTAAAAALVAGLGVACSLAPTLARAAEFDRSFTFQSQRITVTNLIGSVRVEKAAAGEARVQVQVRGADADAKWIQFDTDDSHGRLTIRFPLDEHRNYVYPKLGSGSRSSFSVNEREDHDWFGQLFDLATGDRIEVRGRSWGSGLEIWADVVVQVPSGHEAIVQLGVGDIEAADVTGDLQLKVKSGAVRAEDITGDLLVDTGSGSVDVRGVKGELDIDTGSGSVEVADVSADRTVKIDTGSGHVEVANVDADALQVDTGSGGVDVSKVEVKDLTIDTGSGGVDASDVAADDVKIDTGSGGVSLDLVRMGGGRYDVDTGSGGIQMDMPRDISAVFDVETSSGGIVADIDGVTLDRKERNQAHFRVGSGDARVSLSTGSGRIRLAQGRGGSATR